MFSPQITDSDAFLDMPVSAQNLYFHLGMRADDDGFVGNPRRILRTIGGNDDDLKLLIAKRFVLTFESGVIVIKHWRINNLIRKDWYRPTQYVEEKSKLFLKENGSYTEDSDKGTPVVNESLTNSVQVRPRRLGKVSIKKDDFTNVQSSPSESVQEEESSEETDLDGRWVEDANGTSIWQPSKEWIKNHKKAKAVPKENVAQIFLLYKKFSDLCEKHLGTRPVMDGKGRQIIRFALNTGGLTEKQILDLFDEWFTLSHDETELIQITRALSSNQINSYKIRNGK